MDDKKLDELIDELHLTIANNNIKQPPPLSFHDIVKPFILKILSNTGELHANIREREESTQQEM